MKNIFHSRFGFLALTLAWLSLTLSAEARTWTQASTGRTIEGEFVKIDGGNVHIKQAAGTVIPVPLAMLSDADKKFLKEQAKAPAPVAPSGDKPATPTEDGEPLTVALHEMHLCCKGCEGRVKDAATEIEGVELDIERSKENRDKKIAVLSAPNKKAAQDSINAIIEAGFYGESDSHEVDFKAKGASSDKVKSATVSATHLCCKECLTAVEKALASVEGIEEHTAKSKAESFEITGDFQPSEVLKYLRRAGLNAKIE